MVQPCILGIFVNKFIIRRTQILIQILGVHYANKLGRNPKLHIVAAGSMLEFSLENISFPVGRVSVEWMRPMTFYESLIASDKKILAEELPCFSNFRPVRETTHQKVIEQLKIYLLVGGMPEAVKRYTRTGSVNQSFEVHEDIFQSYIGLCKFILIFHVDKVRIHLCLLDPEIENKN